MGEEGSVASGAFNSQTSGTFAGQSTIADNDVGGSVVFDDTLMPGGMLDGGNSTISNVTPSHVPSNPNLNPTTPGGLGANRPKLDNWDQLSVLSAPSTVLDLDYDGLEGGSIDASIASDPTFRIEEEPRTRPQVSDDIRVNLIFGLLFVYMARV